MPAVSIIVSVYNQETYIGRCLDSIVAQTFPDYEALLVDDGSSDASADICETYCHNDSRFHLIHKANGGVSSARNVGISIARGVYILFVDADDILPARALEIHLSAFSEDVDMTLGAYETFSDENGDGYAVVPECECKKTIGEALTDFTPNGECDWQRYLWNRMMRSEIIRDSHLEFNEAIHYKEDGLFLVQYLLRSQKKVAYLEDIVYRYRQNPLSAMGSLSVSYSPKLLTNFDAHILIIREMKRFKVDQEVLDRQIRHSFQSRNWILDIMKTIGVPTFNFRYTSIARLYCVAGVKHAARHFYHHLKK